jgi:hypothetical protein
MSFILFFYFFFYKIGEGKGRTDPNQGNGHQWEGGSGGERE